MIAGYDLLRFAHILLFAYWLGADLGVFLGARRAGRVGTPYGERVAIREVVTAVDMAPRSALILMLPVGFSLGTRWGLPLPAEALTAIWIAALAWFGLMWGVHLWSGTSAGEVARRTDLTVRYLLLIALALLGIASMLGLVAAVPAWLALKLFLFAAIIACGLRLRVYAGANVGLMAKLAEGPNHDAEVRLDQNRVRAARVALSLWFLVFVMAFLGVTKPELLAA